MSGLDWNREPLKRWLLGRKSVAAYRSAMQKFIEFTESTPERLLIEKEEDLKLPPRKQGKSEARLKGFFNWLKTEYVSPKTGKSLAPKAALTYVGAIAGFYSVHNLKLNIRWTDFKASPLTVNATEKMTATQVQKLASFAPELRDKAIIWCMFQGLMDISTVLSLNYGDIEKEIRNPPMNALMIRDIVRGKEEVPHHMLIYETAVKYVKFYLEERAGKQYWKVLKYNDPLFLGRSGARHSSRYVQDLLREIAPLTFIANSRFEHADMNPLRPHSLRASGSDQLAKAGAVKEFRDFLMGHKVDFDCAYFGGEEGLRKTYVNYAKQALEPTGVPPEIEEKLQDVESLKRMFTEERKHREELEERLEKANEKRVKIERQIERLRREDADIDKIIEVLSMLVNAPMGYSGKQEGFPELIPEEEWFDKPMERAEKILAELKKRRADES